jgi:hypothetical protein
LFFGILQRREILALFRRPSVSEWNHSSSTVLSFEVIREKSPKEAKKTTLNTAENEEQLKI